MALSLAFGLSACGGSSDDEAVKDEATEKKDDTEKAIEPARPMMKMISSSR